VGGWMAMRRCCAIVRLLIYRDNCQMTKWGVLLQYQAMEEGAGTGAGQDQD